MKKGKQVAESSVEAIIMEEGSIIHIDYDLFNANTEKLIESTRENVAKEHDIFDENRTYSPMISIVGAGRLIKGFELHLEDAETDTDYNFDIDAVDGYGERDQSLIETISQNVLMKSVRDPNTLHIGGPVEIGERTGILQFLSAGRARIDYNHPLAGTTLRYNYRIVKVVEDRKERVETLLKMNTGREDFEVEFDGDDMTVTLPEEISYDQNWPYAKFSLVQTIRENLGVGIVIFREIHKPRIVEEE